MVVSILLCRGKRLGRLRQIPARLCEADLAARLTEMDMARRTVGIEHAVAGNNGFRMKGLDLVERLKPLVARLFVVLREIEMRVVVDGVASHDSQPDGNRSRHPGASTGVGTVYA